MKRIGTLEVATHTIYAFMVMYIAVYDVNGMLSDLWISCYAGKIPQNI